MDVRDNGRDDSPKSTPSTLASDALASEVLASDAPASDAPAAPRPPRGAGKPAQVRPPPRAGSRPWGPDGRPLLQFKSSRVSQPPVHLADLTLPERARRSSRSSGLPAFRAKQLSVHYFQHYTTDPERMSDLPKDRRAELVASMFPKLLTEVKRLTTDKGDTIKFLWRLFDGSLVESVLMRYPGRITLCVSSQCGCGMNCPFCATGQAGLTRNMSTAEILDQIVQANRVIAEGGRGGPPTAATTPSASPTSSSWAWASRWPTTSASWTRCTAWWPTPPRAWA